MNIDLLIGWVLGFLSSILSGIILFILQTRRDERIEKLKQRRADTRSARNWARDGKKESLRGFDFSGENLSGKDLSGADLEDTNFERARLWGTNFGNTNLRNASFRKAKIVAAKFQGADLLHADFSGAELRSVDFTGATLRKTNFKKVVISDSEPCIWTSVVTDETVICSDALRIKIQKGLQRGSDQDKPGNGEQ